MSIANFVTNKLKFTKRAARRMFTSHRLVLESDEFNIILKPIYTNPKIKNMFTKSRMMTQVWSTAIPIPVLVNVFPKPITKVLTPKSSKLAANHTNNPRPLMTIKYATFWRASLIPSHGHAACAYEGNANSTSAKERM